MGGKDVVYLKQQKDSLLQECEVQSLLKKLVDERFSETTKGDNILVHDESSRKMKVILRIIRYGIYIMNLVVAIQKVVLSVSLKSLR